MCTFESAGLNFLSDAFSEGKARMGMRSIGNIVDYLLSKL